MRGSPRGSRKNFDEDIEMYASKTTLQPLSPPGKSISSPKQNTTKEHEVITPTINHSLLNGRRQGKQSSECYLTVTVTQC